MAVWFACAERPLAAPANVMSAALVSGGNVPVAVEVFCEVPFPLLLLLSLLAVCSSPGCDHPQLEPFLQVPAKKYLHTLLEVVDLYDL